MHTCVIYVITVYFTQEEFGTFYVVFRGSYQSAIPMLFFLIQQSFSQYITLFDYIYIYIYIYICTSILCTTEDAQ
jgi:hypothetical protein